MLMKATSGAIPKSKKFADSPEKMKEMMDDLKIKNYIR